MKPYKEQEDGSKLYENLVHVIAPKGWELAEAEIKTTYGKVADTGVGSRVTPGLAFRWGTTFQRIKQVRNSNVVEQENWLDII